MEHVLTVTQLNATCSCGNFTVDLVEDKNPRGKIEQHGKENNFNVLVNDMSL